MRKTATKLSAILLLMFVFLLNGNCASALAKEKYIRVGLSYGNGAVSSCSAVCDNGFMIAEAGPDGFEEILRLPECKQITASINSSRISAVDATGAVLYDGFGIDTCIIPIDFSSGGTIRYDGKPYRGGLCFYPAGNGRMNIINCIGLEDYLYGVLNSELGSQNPLEALKAQAVAARSFTVSNTGKHKGEGFDLCPDAHCQVYKGYSDEYPETNRAVDETSGLTLTYGGETVSGHYFKNSGGHTQSVSDVWGADAPYLTGVKDEYSPEYRWDYTMSFQEAGRKLEAAGYDIGKLKAAAITARSLSGAVSSMEFTGARGTAELKNERIRAVFGSVNIKSLNFSFRSGTAGEYSGQSEDVFILGAGGAVGKLKPGDIYVLSGGVVSKMTDYRPVCDGEVETVTDGTIVFSGTGFGHGVGMPQDSAVEMADQGFSYDEILSYFFTGISIQ